MALNTPQSTISQVAFRVDHRRSFMIIAAVAALILSANLQLYLVHAAPPMAKIVNLDYPHHALSGTTFPVTVIAQYSEKVGIDIGIWDAENGAVVQSISIPLRDIGPISFTFNLTAPTGTGEWRLLAITRIWWLNAWYQDPLEGSKPFTVSISGTTTVSLTASVTPLSISLDGVNYTVSNLHPVNLSVAPGIHRLDAMSVVPGNVGERFVFVGWSDGTTSNPRLVTIAHDLNLTAIYDTECYLSVKSDHGEIIGAGWYPAGSNATFAVVSTPNSPVSLGPLGENYEFVGWSGDSNSSEALASVVMDGPRNVEARWTPSGITIMSPTISTALLLGALVLSIRVAYRNHRGRASRTSLRRTHQWSKLTLVVVILIAVMVQTPSTYAQLPIQSGRSIVKIGDASWYYWNNTASDTCLVWLGGGTIQEQEVGAYSYMINPLEYESFGTIRFIQDLTKYYCFIALQKGSSLYYSVDSNRTIYQEPYRMDSRILGDVHDWIKRQGYAHTFLVGYSAGADVAAMEMAIRDPTEWVSPDGLVLITPRLSQVVSRSGYRMRASLLVIYGGSIETPAYISTGHDFFVNAPTNGWYASSYFYKQFQVIEKMGHEVWTVYETGVYDTQAERTLVSFVNNVKTLQFTSKDLNMITNAAQNTSAIISHDLDLTSVEAPSQISAAAIVTLRAMLAYGNQETTTAQIIAFNTQSGNIEGAQEFILGGSGLRILLLNLLPPSNSTELSLAVIALMKTNNGWQPDSNPVFTKTEIRDTIRVTVASTLPYTSFVFDGTEFRIPESGTLDLDTQPGSHIAQVEPVIYVTPQMRVVFMGWDDGNIETTRQLSIDNDTSLYLSYRLQYFLNVTSPYGRATESGWYDSNSTAVVFVQPPIVSEGGVVFAQWKGDVNSSEIRVPLYMNSPKTSQAEWVPLPTTGPMAQSTAIFLFSLVLLALALLWNIKPVKRTQTRTDAG